MAPVSATPASSTSTRQSNDHASNNPPRELLAYDLCLGASPPAELSVSSKRMRTQEHGSTGPGTNKRAKHSISEASSRTPGQKDELLPQGFRDIMLVDISEDAMKAEIEQVIQETLLSRAKTMFDDYQSDTDADSDGSDAEDDESEGREDRQFTKPRRRTWVKPGPSPLRHEYRTATLNLVDTRPVTVETSFMNQASGSLKKVRVRTPRRDLRSNMQTAAFLGKCLQWPEADPLTGAPTTGAGDAGNRAEDDSHLSSSKTTPDNDPAELSVQALPMGNGTPPGGCFSERQTLRPPASPYKYSVRDRTLPARRFTQCAFFGNESWCTLIRSDRAVAQCEDIDEDRVFHTLLVGAGDTARLVVMRTDCKAMDLWREHEEHAWSTLWDRAHGETTGSIIQEIRIVRSLLVQRGGSPSPQSPGLG